MITNIMVVVAFLGWAAVLIRSERKSASRWELPEADPKAMAWSLLESDARLKERHDRGAQ